MHLETVVAVFLNIQIVSERRDLMSVKSHCLSWTINHLAFETPQKSLFPRREEKQPVIAQKATPARYPTRGQGFQTNVEQLYRAKSAPLFYFKMTTHCLAVMLELLWPLVGFPNFLEWITYLQMEETHFLSFGCGSPPVAHFCSSDTHAHHTCLGTEKGVQAITSRALSFCAARAVRLGHGEY